MGAISQQLVDEIGPSHFRFNARVTDVSDQGITLENGEFIPADKVILATEHNDFLQKFGHIEKVQYRSVTCLQFEAPESPLPEKMIAVNANKDAIIGNLVVMSDFAPEYAPKGKSTVYVSLNGLSEFDDVALKDRVLEEIKQLTGTSVEKWKLLRTLRIPKALPFQTSVLGKRHIDSFRINDHLFVCGDHLLYGSINAAMKSGRIIAEEIIKEFKRNLHVRKGHS
jgi:protoporphyrinogen oxidase